MLPSSHHEGVLQEALERHGGRGVKVRARLTSPLDGTYDFSWE